MKRKTIAFCFLVIIQLVNVIRFPCEGSKKPFDSIQHEKNRQPFDKSGIYFCMLIIWCIHSDTITACLYHMKFWYQLHLSKKNFVMKQQNFVYLKLYVELYCAFS